MSEEQKASQKRGVVYDQQLLAWMKEDFDRGFGKVVEHYWRELSCWAYQLLSNSGFPHLHEDTVQEVFFSAYKNLRHYRQKLDTLHLRHWLYAIVRQKAMMCLLHEHKIVHLAGLLGWENEGEDVAARRSADTTFDPAFCLERGETICETRRTVMKLLKGLSESQREVVMLKYLSPDGTEPEEIPYQQIAEKLNKPVGTVRSDMSRALYRMRTQLTNNGEKRK